MQFEVEHEEDMRLPEDAIFDGKLESIVPREMKWQDKKTLEQKSELMLNFWFEVTSGEHKGKKAKCETRAKISDHPQNRFRPIAETLLNRQLEEKMKIDTDDLIGLPCQFSVKWEADKKDASKTWVVVDEILPADGSSFGMGDEPPF